MSYVRGLKFADRPDYSYLKRLYKELFFREGYFYDFVFDWVIIKEVGNYHALFSVYLHRKRGKLGRIKKINKLERQLTLLPHLNLNFQNQESPPYNLN